ncbi:MAG: LptF/LptG family permease [Gemmatimonadaceae bacterium]|nr:LptF/LptG family permease [Gemmatimonadaceae bacterium]
MMRWLLRPLDRYVIGEWTKIFLSTSLGFPLIVTIFDLTDNIDKYLNRNLSPKAIALSYLYSVPDSMFMVLPAAVLFATVFSIGAFTRYSEINAAKASGISFHRLTLPIFFGALVATGMTLALGEVAPTTNSRTSELRQETRFTSGNERFNFTFAAEQNRVYKASLLNVERAYMEGIEVERKGREDSDDYPSYIVSAREAAFVPGGWAMRDGTLHVIPGVGRDVAFRFDSLVDRHMHETPVQLMASSKAPSDMGYTELGRYITALERSGSDVNVLRVDRALKLAIPVTCMIIALFGAPLATSNHRGGAAYGIGLSLGTTVIFLIMIQLTKAVGGKGVLTPEMAAWTPNLVFGVVGLIMLMRVRT